MRQLRPLLLLAAAMLAATTSAFANEALLSEARTVASMVPPKLLQVLTEEIAKGGPASAVEVCNVKAPQMAKAASEQTGWTIKRVSLQNRNPKAVPDAWERAVLEDFDKRAAAGESPATLEKGELINSDANGKEYRYMRALPVGSICLTCHGTADKLNADVKTKLQLLYPNDKAVGYTVGQLRGAMTIRKAQP
ncbi:MAG TPA: DUF3365 domain-containing protein [Burkholderiaceae bacterium]|nr:DUF3365 domain-containing protein [Burkholderiaceae bacterium]